MGEHQYPTAATIIIFILFLVGVLVVIGWCMRKNKSSYTPSKHVASVKKEKYARDPRMRIQDDPDDFYIYNYLLKPIRIEVLPAVPGAILGTVKAPEVLVDRIEPQSRKQFDLEEIVKYLLPGNRLRIFILQEKDRRHPKKHYSDYVLDTPEDTTIRRLFVGMITSRWIGADFVDQASPGTAVQGMPWIKMHNFTDQTISLNNNIDISPGGILRYTGSDHIGVKLGTVFKDQNGLYPTFIFSTPATDVYYGVTSDLQQSLFGGWQLGKEFDPSADEPMWLLENGWMGGDAEGSIPTGYLPVQGRYPPPPADRWGRPLDPSKDIPPSGAPVEFLDP